MPVADADRASSDWSTRLWASLSSFASLSIQTLPDWYAVNRLTCPFASFKGRTCRALAAYAFDDPIKLGRRRKHEAVTRQKTPGPLDRSGGFRGLLKFSSHLSGGDGGIRTHDTGISRMHP
jgi:hypothetical protein